MLVYQRVPHKSFSLGEDTIHGAFGICDVIILKMNIKTLKGGFREEHLGTAQT
jgi:hypothetical protein